jgi:Skp family chaperone for outer membrane proteins
MRPHHLLLCLTAAFTLGAHEPAPRFAMLVPERIVENTARGKKLFAELDVLKKTLDERIQTKRAEIQKLASQLQSPSISEAGKETIQKQLRDLDFEGKKLQDDSQMEFQRTQQRVVGQFQQELGPLVDELAKEQKLQMVLTYQPGLVAYMDQAWGLSFTDEVGRRYDAKYAAGATKPAAGAPAAKPAAGAPKPAAKPAAPKAAPKAVPAP